MSNFYFDVLKDRLYTEKKDGKLRRAAQTAIYTILDAMARMIAPILAYTSDEIWQFMPHDSSANAENVMFNDMPELTGVELDDSFISMWDRIHETRDIVKKAIEPEIKAKKIRTSLEAKITLKCTGEQYDFLKDAEKELASSFIVSQVDIVNEAADELEVTVSAAEGEKCERCWIYSKTVGQHPVHKTLCARCAAVLEQE
jgi:isoleucyl-tRNA synthetase